ncbi:MAG TPA: Bax inhibitor-1/YccA family protein, partial [Acidimicrobiales bacterium]|nr:Bax inhibitor-1/YccA family protein [Acidimicrobiales bacterium]
VGVISYALNLPPALAFIGAIGGLGVVLWTNFHPTIAKTTAPIYALLQGLTLGILSRWTAGSGYGIVTMALLGTLGVYFAVLTLYRTGWVRVTQGFTKAAFVIVMGTMFAAFGYMILNMLHFPVLSSVGSRGGTFVIFGVLYLVSGIMTLFVDFAFIDNAGKSSGLSRDGEWYAALTVLISLVMIYLGLLRIIGAFGGGGSRS